MEVEEEERTPCEVLARIKAALEEGRDPFVEGNARWTTGPADSRPFLNSDDH
jgi:hypothetical protein